MQDLELVNQLAGVWTFSPGTNVKPEVDAWIAAQRLNRLAQAL
jgi:hypothetical protein